MAGGAFDEDGYEVADLRSTRLLDAAIPRGVDLGTSTAWELAAHPRPELLELPRLVQRRISHTSEGTERIRTVRDRSDGRVSECVPLVPLGPTADRDAPQGGFAIRGDQVAAVEASQLGDVGDGNLEGAEWPERWDIGLGQGLQIDAVQRRCLVENETHRRKLVIVATASGSDLPEQLRDQHATVGRVIGSEHGSGEDGEPERVDEGVVEDMVLDAGPEVLILVERRSLRCGIDVDERVDVGSCGIGTPDRVPSTDQVPPVKVVSRVNARTSLLLHGNTRIKVPVIPAAELDQRGAVNIHRGRGLSTGSNATVKCVYGSTTVGPDMPSVGAESGWPRNSAMYPIMHRF